MPALVPHQQCGRSCAYRLELRYRLFGVETQTSFASKEKKVETQVCGALTNGFSAIYFHSTQEIDGHLRFCLVWK